MRSERINEKSITLVAEPGEKQDFTSEKQLLCDLIEVIATGGVVRIEGPHAEWETEHRFRPKETKIDPDEYAGLFKPEKES